MEQTLQNVAMQADINQESKEQHVNIDFKMVAFSLGGKDYAIDILKVKEIAKADRFTYVPNTSPFVIGVYNLRGEIIPIIDLRIFFNIPYDDCAENNFENMIIVGFGEQKYATIVDSIERVVGIDSASVQPPHPLFSDINIKYIYGIVENEDRMYILLDIERIFGANSAQNYEQREMRVVPHAKIASGTVPDSGPQKVSQSSQDSIPQKEKTASAVQPESVSPGAGESSVPVVFAAKNDPELKFLLESLKKFKNFNKSSVNESWVFNRFAQWKEERGSNNVQLHDMSDAESFLKPFYSQSSSKFWTKQYADAIYEALPDNSAKQITVWNPGCGDGYEAFSLACLLKKRYPNAKIKIYAHDNDLIVISSAPLLQIPQSDAEGWYKPFLSKTVEGNVIFSPEIRDSVLFEYHDCTHMNAIPPVDIIFSRDLLSFVQAESLDHVCLDFYEKIKENGIVMLGDNEVFSDHQKWLEKTYGSVIVYNKQ